MTDLIIVGAGAAGLFCAVMASTNKVNTVVIDHSPMPGKKLLSTGNGKCNLTNLEMSSDKYYCDNMDFVDEMLDNLGPGKLLDIFEGFGLITRQRDGYVYPYSEQATAVRDMLLSACVNNGVEIISDYNIEQIKKKDGFFKVTGNGDSFTSKYLLLACGGKTFEKSGSDGSGYKLATDLGHSITKPLPALTALICEGEYFKQLKGVRAKGRVNLVLNDKTLASDIGEIQFTDYGVSGIPVFNISRVASRLLNEREVPVIHIDLMPEYFSDEIKELVEKVCDYNLGQINLNYVLNNKLAEVILRISGINEHHNKNITGQDINNIVKNIKDLHFKVRNVKSFDFAQVTTGGVKLKEINTKTLESKIVTELYIIGEMLDIDGICGGYNLHMAFATAYTAAMDVINKKENE